MVRCYLPYLFIIALLMGCGNRTIAGIDRPPNIILKERGSWGWEGAIMPDLPRRG